MGGALALYAATKNSKVGACVVFTVVTEVKPDLPNLGSPVLGIYAERDGSVTPQLVHELESQLKKLENHSKPIFILVLVTLSSTIHVRKFTMPKLRPMWRRTIEF
jgi:dienelactone hydrolase